LCRQSVVTIAMVVAAFHRTRVLLYWDRKITKKLSQWDNDLTFKI